MHDESHVGELVKAAIDVPGGPVHATADEQAEISNKRDGVRSGCQMTPDLPSDPVGDGAYSVARTQWVVADEAIYAFETIQRDWNPGTLPPCSVRTYSAFRYYRSGLKRQYHRRFGPGNLASFLQQETVQLHGGLPAQ